MNGMNGLELPPDIVLDPLDVPLQVELPVKHKGALVALEMLLVDTLDVPLQVELPVRLDGVLLPVTHPHFSHFLLPNAFVLC